MKSIGKWFIACLLVQCRGSEVRAEVSTIEEVINILDGLKVKSEHEHTAEEIAYAKYRTFCDEKTSYYTKEIDDLKSKLSAAQADAETAKSGIKAAEGKLEEDAAEKARINAERTQAEDVHSLDSSTSKAQAESLEETLNACHAALDVLLGAKSGVTSLVEMQGTMQRVSSLLEGKLDADSTVALGKMITQQDPYEADGIHQEHTATYKYKAQSVVELVQKLIDKFTAELAEKQGQINNMQNAHDVLIKHLDGRQEENLKLTNLHEADAAAHREALDEANTVISTSTQLLQSNTAALGDVRRACKTKADEWEQRSTTRASEQAAIQKAKEILAESEGIKLSDPIVASTTASFFLQIPDVRAKAASLLRQAGRNLRSSALNEIAMQVMAHSAGHFDVVINEIEKMVFNLNEEQLLEDQVFQKLDAEFYRWTRDHKQTSDRIDQLVVLLTELNGKISVASDTKSESETSLAQAESDIATLKAARKADREENLFQISESHNAQEAITNAINILTKFYKDSGMIEKESWESLLQRHSDPLPLPEPYPETWTVHPYTGVADPTHESHGVIAVLESLNAQFMEMEAKYKQAEETNQAEFDAELTDLTSLRSNLVQEVKNLVAEIERLQGQADEAETEKQRKSEELESIEHYLLEALPAVGGSGFDSSTPAPLTADAPYHDDASYHDNLEYVKNYRAKKSSRAEEITALREAAAILKASKAEPVEAQPVEPQPVAVGFHSRTTADTRRPVEFHIHRDVPDVVLHQPHLHVQRHSFLHPRSSN
jgi:chromosome segregation ATPase